MSDWTQDEFLEHIAAARVHHEAAQHVEVRERDVLIWTGFDKSVVGSLVQRLTTVDLDDLIIALNVLHHDLSWEFAAAVWKIPKTTVVRRVSAVLDSAVTLLAAEANRLHAERSSTMDTRLTPRITGILDGFPIYCRGKDELYNGKKKAKYLSVQVFVTLNGDPIAMSEPMEGRVHDSSALQTPLFAQHRRDEIWLADLAYINNPHCLCPYKKPRNAELTEQQKLFNHVHSHRRARIERFLSYICRHKFARRNDHQPDFISRGLKLLWLAEVVRWQITGTRNRYSTAASRTQGFSEEVCECSLQKVHNSAERLAMYALRDDIANGMWAGRDEVAAEVVPRAPRNCKRQRDGSPAMPGAESTTDDEL